MMLVLNANFDRKVVAIEQNINSDVEIDDEFYSDSKLISIHSQMKILLKDKRLISHTMM
jgi:hypothetical protein